MKFRDERGFTLLMVLVMVVIMGLGLGLAGSTWKDVMQRAREQELFWRGSQYRRAIKSFFEAGPGGTMQAFPASLDDLIRDPRFPGVRRHLRDLYLDPMTGEEWDLVKNPAGRILGVRSRSELKPFRQDGFPQGFEPFQGKTSYREWEFVFTAQQPTATPPGTGPKPTDVLNPRAGQPQPSPKPTDFLPQ
jgi:type II secretory pathway pseudopilin PulG